MTKGEFNIMWENVLELNCMLLSHEVNHESDGKANTLQFPYRTYWIQRYADKALFRGKLQPRLTLLGNVQNQCKLPHFGS